MLKKANLPLSAKQITKMMGQNKLMFDNIVQRGLTWETRRKSLLIHSMIMGYPIPPLYSARANGGYDILDGKQRCHAIADFINGEYRLTELPEVVTEEDEEIDVSGMKFDELPEEIQDVIKDYSLTIYYYEDITQDEIMEMFSRLNNGKPLTAIEITRVKAKSKEQIQYLSNHELFKECMSQKQIGGYKHEDIIIKSWIVMYGQNKSLETKHVRPLVESVEITDEQIKEMEMVFDRLQEAHDTILINDSSKLAKKIAKRVYTMTHLISLAPITLQSIKEEIDIEVYTNFIKEFFGTEEVATISENYNSKISAGANKKESVEVRLSEIEMAYNNHLIEEKEEV